MASTPPSIRVGTASWSEPEFVKAKWHPNGLLATARLPFYAQHFGASRIEAGCGDWL